MSQKVQSTDAEAVLERELAYYETLYSSDVAGHFAKPAVVAFREYLVERILRVAGAGPESRALSIGCGVGDTELLLARRVAHVTGVDLSATAIREANRAASEQGVRNVSFVTGAWQAAPVAGESFDLVVAIFFLHHLHAEELAAFPGALAPVLRPGAVFYGLEPSLRRLSGFLGKLLVPKLMKKYQTEDERQLLPSSTAEPFRAAGFDADTHWFDFCSTPLAGLFPGWASGYRLARVADEALTRCPGVRELSSNFELIARSQ